MYAVHPKLDCPHVKETQILQAIQTFNREIFLSPCKKCDSSAENWYCFECETVFCSRFVAGHMAKHNEANQDHSIAFSFSDASVWCYECDSYIYSHAIRLFAKKFQEIKFPEGEKYEEEEEGGGGGRAMGRADSSAGFTESGSNSFSREEFIHGLKAKQFRKISVLTGAGISVAAGIPDFRTPEIGLYAKVEKYGLPYPELVFNLQYFRTNPYPFYQISKEFFNYTIQPVAAHQFIKMLEKEELLFRNYTQNIDGLELEIGLSPNKLIQAHGHLRSAHCLDCEKEYLKMKDFYQCLEEDCLWLCDVCNPDASDLKGNPAASMNEEGEKVYKGLIKPDIVFFGESLPRSFGEQFHAIQESDLVIVMGTSLKVYPFALLLQFLPENVPVVLINRENPGVNRNRLLFLPGDIQETVEGIAKECDWDLSTVTPPLPAHEK